MTFHLLKLRELKLYLSVGLTIKAILKIIFGLFNNLFCKLLRVGPIVSSSLLSILKL